MNTKMHHSVTRETVRPFAEHTVSCAMRFRPVPSLISRLSERNKLKNYLFVALLPLAVAGCVDNPAPRPLTEAEMHVLQSATKVAGYMVTAELIADECPRYSYLRKKEDEVWYEFFFELYNDGYTDEQTDVLDYTPPASVVAKAQSDLFDWIEENGVVFEYPETFCAAGDAEVAAGSEIAQFLKKRG